MLKFVATTETIRKLRSERPNYNRDKVVKFSSGKLLFLRNFRYLIRTRVELSYLDIGNKTITKEERIN